MVTCHVNNTIANFTILPTIKHPIKLKYNSVITPARKDKDNMNYNPILFCSIKN